MRGRMVL
jgi:hypothetical protein